MMYLSSNLLEGLSLLSERATSCPSGSQFYSCSNAQSNFVGCCSQEACNKEGCPDDSSSNNSRSSSDSNDSSTDSVSSQTSQETQEDTKTTSSETPTPTTSSRPNVVTVTASPTTSSKDNKNNTSKNQQTTQQPAAAKPTTSSPSPTPTTSSSSSSSSSSSTSGPSPSSTSSSTTPPPATVPQSTENAAPAISIGDSSQPSSGSSKMPVAKIAGGTVGGIAALALLGLLIFYCIKKRKEGQQESGFSVDRPNSNSSNSNLVVKKSYGGSLNRSSPQSYDTDPPLDDLEKPNDLRSPTIPNVRRPAYDPPSGALRVTNTRLSTSTTGASRYSAYNPNPAYPSMPSLKVQPPLPLNINRQRKELPADSHYPSPAVSELPGSDPIYQSSTPFSYEETDDYLGPSPGRPPPQQKLQPTTYVPARKPVQAPTQRNLPNQGPPGGGGGEMNRGGVGMGANLSVKGKGNEEDHVTSWNTYRASSNRPNERAGPGPAPNSQMPGSNAAIPQGPSPSGRRRPMPLGSTGSSSNKRPPGPYGPAKTQVPFGPEDVGASISRRLVRETYKPPPPPGRDNSPYNRGPTRLPSQASSNKSGASAGSRESAWKKGFGDGWMADSALGDRQG